MRLTLGEIADMLESRVQGDRDAWIDDVRPLADAEPTHLSWLANPERYGKHVAETRAAGVLIPPGFTDVPAGLNVIPVDDPDVAMITVLRCLAPPLTEVAPGVHPTAVVDRAAQVAPSARIGPHVVIGPESTISDNAQLHAGVSVGRNVTIGAHATLWPNVVVHDYTQIGERVTIFANSTIGTDGFGFVFRDKRHLRIPQIGNVVIEDDVEIGANTCIDRARSGTTRIRQGAKIDNLVQVAHNCDIGACCILVGQVGLSGSVTLESGVVLAGQVGIADHVRIGAGAMVAAKSGIPTDVPGGQVYRGIPAGPVAEWSRQQAGVRRLPKLIEQVRDLTKRVRELESPADD